MANRKIRLPKDPIAQFGFEIPNFNEDDEEEDDEDLEAELKDLLSGKEISRSQQRTPIHKKKKSFNTVDISTIELECEDIADEVNEGPISDEDELLVELHDLTTRNADSNISSPEKIPETAEMSHSDSSVHINILLKDRLNLYKQALEVAKQCNDASKCRRYERAMKTLESLTKIANSGGLVKEEDVPPAVSIPKPKISRTETSICSPQNIIPTSTESEALTPESEALTPESEAMPESEALSPYATSTIQQDVSNIQSQLASRRCQYKLAAIKAKKSGDIETAMRYLKIVKKFDAVISAEAKGELIDLSNMPPPLPGIAFQNPARAPSVKPSEIHKEREAQTTPTPEKSELEVAALEAAKGPVDSKLFNAPPIPNNALEALQQRLERYCSTRDAAKSEGNLSKARRLQRIVQQYEIAIKNYKAAKPVNFEELPCPPGFAPIPLDCDPKTNSDCSDNISQPPVKPVVSSSDMSKDEQHTEKPESNQSKSSYSKPVEPSTSTGRNPRIQRANTSSILDRQLRFLLERQKLFRQAALESKKKGEIEQAKVYLRMSKGFDSMIEATRNGLPVDTSEIPTPPQLEAEFVIINEEDNTSNALDIDSSKLYPTLEKELQHQIQMCCRNKDHFMRLGDVTSGSKFEKLAIETTKDLAYIQQLWRNNEPAPIFHYETRLFSLVQCNTDLSDSEIEISVERGINFPGKPDQLISYVRLDLAIPAESPQRAKTHSIRNTNNPEFNQSFKFEINRKSRSQIRQFKKPVLKFEVFSKGWFFKGDTVLGTVNMKLVELETKCSIHNSFDLMEGRKPCGGKLEVRVRVRDPLLAKQVEEVKEKWLVIGN